MKVTHTRVYRTTTKKDGTPLITKTGKPYESVRIQTVQHGDRWLSGFGSPVTDQWKDGQEVEITVTPSGQYLNFSVPSRLDLLEARVMALENFIKKEPNTSDTKEPPLDEPPSDDQMDVSDIPF
jgi:hypothetical protein